MSDTSSSAIVPIQTPTDRFLSASTMKVGAKTRTSSVLPIFSSIDREVIKRELERALLYFIECDYPCVLEGFGIIFPIEKQIQRVSNASEDHFVLTVETERSIDFEKTDEIHQSHRLQFPKLLDERDISDRVFEKTHARLSVRCSEPDIRKVLKKICASIKDETIQCGRSTAIVTLGIFTAQHNRQGKSSRDWFAGSDIFIDKPWRKTTKIESTSRLPRPILKNAHEPFMMFYGAPRSTKPYRLNEELTGLGYEVPSMISEDFQISVGAFLNDSTKGKKIVSFVSDGLRHLQKNPSGNAIGSEIVVQMPIADIDAISLDNSCELDVSKFPKFLGQIFALSALLICSSKTKQMPHGVGVELDLDALGDARLGELTTLIAFPFTRLGQMQHDMHGNFYYSVVSLIAADEAQLIKNGKKYLLSLFLTRKGYDQVISIQRRSVCRRSANCQLAPIEDFLDTPSISLK